jgi:hypothetical protein
MVFDGVANSLLANPDPLRPLLRIFIVNRVHEEVSDPVVSFFAHVARPAGTVLPKSELFATVALDEEVLNRDLERDRRDVLVVVQVDVDDSV